MAQQVGGSIGTAQRSSVCAGDSPNYARPQEGGQTPAKRCTSSAPPGDPRSRRGRRRPSCSKRCWSPLMKSCAPALTPAPCASVSLPAPPCVLAATRTPSPPPRLRCSPSRVVGSTWSRRSVNSTGRSKQSLSSQPRSSPRASASDRMPAAFSSPPRAPVPAQEGAGLRRPVCVSLLPASSVRQDPTMPPPPRRRPASELRAAHRRLSYACAAPRTRAYVERRTRDGLARPEILRCLNRYITREIHPLLLLAQTG